MSILVISEDPDEMTQNVAFHQGLHCLQGWHHSLEIMTCGDPIHRLLLCMESLSAQKLIKQILTLHAG